MCRKAESSEQGNANKHLLASLHNHGATSNMAEHSIQTHIQTNVLFIFILYNLNVTVKSFYRIHE